MSEGDPIIWQLVLQIVLISINAIFACAEIAIITMNDNKIQKLSESGDKRAIRLLKLTENPARFLSTIQVGITFAGFLGSAFAAGNFSHKLVNFIVYTGILIPRSTLESLSVIIITVILSYFTLVFGELVPKRIAMGKAEQLALLMSKFIYFVSVAFSPIVHFLTFSTNAILKLIGIDPNENNEQVTEEEIRMMLDAGSQNGTIKHEEREMIKNVFEFNDTTAEEIMTHRIEVSILWLDETQKQWEQTISESKHSRYPVCNENTDDIVGVLNIKDYYKLKDKGYEAIKSEGIHHAYFVPETIKTDVLLRDMQKKRNHFAVVLDEYGGMSGIVTISDLVEEIFGDMDDSDKIKEPDIERIDSQTWKIRGGVSLEQVAETLDINLPLEEYDTFGGFVFGSLNTIPEDGSKPILESYGLNIKVEKIKDHRIELSIVCKIDNIEEE